MSKLWVIATLTALFTPIFLPFVGLCQDTNYATTLNVNFDNDFLNIKMRGSDQCYSDGMLIGFTSQVKKKQLLDRIALASSENAFRIRSFSIEHQLYTPHYIGNPNIQVGDYPYVALLSASYGNRFLERDYSFTSILTIGVQGPAAMGKEIQTYLHRKVFHSNIPQGWEHQLPNDIALCYTFTFDKLLYSTSYVEVIGNTELRLGTLHNSLKMSSQFRFGSTYSFFDPHTWLFTQDRSNAKAQVYLTVEPYVMLVQGNSLLEGGPTNPPGGAWGQPQSRYYHINHDQMKRLVYGYSWALHYTGTKFSLAFQQHFQSAEIKGLPAHEYASIKLGVKL
jgi:lipid A 3-O-deacylase